MSMAGSVRVLSDRSRVQPEELWKCTVDTAESKMVEDRGQEMPPNAREDLKHQECSSIAGGNRKWKTVWQFLT